MKRPALLSFELYPRLVLWGEGCVEESQQPWGFCTKRAAGEASRLTVLSSVRSLPFFLGPLHTTASSGFSSRKPTDMREMLCSWSTKTGTQPLSH